MRRTVVSGLAMGALAGGAAVAETFEVQMLNKGPDGERMVFEPDFVQAQPGHTIEFVEADKGHNVELNKGMHPDGVEIFKGKVNEETEFKPDVQGVYGVICKPHFAIGMVINIAVGQTQSPQNFLEGRVPKKARERFEAQLANLATN